MFTPEQLNLVAEKESARQAVGAPTAAADDDGIWARRGEPTTTRTESVPTSKVELLSAWQQKWDADQAYLNDLANNFPEASKQKRDALIAERQRIEVLRDGGENLQVPSVEVGTYSQYTSTHTWDAETPLDPINTVFYRVGTAWDVQYDMINWAINARKWRLANCGGNQRAYIYDARHTGGWDGWRWMQYQMEPSNSSSTCGSARYHIRLFQSFVQDSHGVFGWWTVGDAHHDPTGHQCTDGWENAETRTADTFRDGNGNRLWFVSSIWEGWYNNQGRFQCADNNGWATYVELNA